jgi:hypothetical protein
MVDGIFNEFVLKWIKKLKDFEAKVIQIIQTFKEVELQKMELMRNTMK